MGVLSDAAVPAGDGPRARAELEREVASNRTARSLEASSVGSGGLRVHGEAGIEVSGGGDMVVKDGGDMGVEDGGRLYATYPSGSEAVKFGHLIFIDTGEDAGYGLLVQADGEAPVDRTDIFRARLNNGERVVLIGETPAPGGAVEGFRSWALEQSHYVYGGVLQLQSFDDGDIEILSDERLWLYGDDTVDIDCPNGNVSVDAGADIVVLADADAAFGGVTGTFLQPEASSGTANVIMDTSTGRITYVSSTERVKRDIRDLDVDQAAVLQIRPRSWLPGPTERQCPEWMHAKHGEGECHGGETVEPPEDARREVGFVAEELDALGLADFVEYDDQDRPSSIRYDRLTAALIPLVQSQQAQIDALSDRLDALERS